VLSVALTLRRFAAEPAYKIVDRIKVPDGGFDYATYDAARSRILMARTISPRSSTPKRGNCRNSTVAHSGIWRCRFGTTLIVLPQRRGTIRIADTATDMVLAELPAERIRRGNL